MTKFRVVFAAVLTSAIGLSFVYTPRVHAAQDTLPARLSDQDFWKLSQDSSEPNGYFQSDNLLSNELGFQYVLPQLVQTARQGAVYLGVGPEQNFTYIAALHPKMVIITDIRRGNLHTQLMYKALFELSADRAEFVSRLFSKKRPDRLTTKSSAADIFNAYWPVDTSPETVYKDNLKAIDDLLTKKHNLPLSDEDLKGIEYVYYNFYWFGPTINYNSSSASGAGRGNYVSYAELMMASDGTSYRSFLANEENYKILKDLEEKNMVVPIVGNFAGPKALRAVGKFLKDHNAVVAAFYLSNVEQYLMRDGIWTAFCQNVATLPLDDKSTFIYSAQGSGGGGGRGGLASALRPMMADVKTCGG